MLYDVIFLMTAIGKISIQFVYYECTIFPFPNDRYGINRNNKDNLSNHTIANNNDPNQSIALNGSPFRLYLSQNHRKWGALSDSPIFVTLSCLSLEQAFEEVIVHQVGHGDLQLGADVHGALNGEHGALVAGPGATADAVIHIPVEHHAQTAVASLAAV